jgi:hypothetical protein
MPTHKILCDVDVGGNITTLGSRSIFAADTVVNSFSGTAGVEVYKNSGDSVLMIHQDNGSNEAVLHFRCGGNDTKIITPAGTNALQIDTESVTDAFVMTLAGDVTFSGGVTATSGTFSGDINANGNIVGDDNTRITNLDSVGCDTLHADAESTTKITMGASEIACLVEDTDVFQVSSTDFIFDSAIKTSIKKRKFAKTSSVDANADGDIVYFGATTSMDAGKIYYYTSGGAWALADASAESTAKGMLAVALGSASDTNGMLIRGMVTLDTDPGTIGDTLFLSETSGVATSTAPSTNAAIVRVIGYCLDSTNGQIYFNPDGTFVEVTA